MLTRTLNINREFIGITTELTTRRCPNGHQGSTKLTTRGVVEEIAPQRKSLQGLIITSVGTAGFEFNGPHGAVVIVGTYVPEMTASVGIGRGWNGKHSGNISRQLYPE